MSLPHFLTCQNQIFQLDMKLTGIYQNCRQLSFAALGFLEPQKQLQEFVVKSSSETWVFGAPEANHQHGDMIRA